MKVFFYTFSPNDNVFASLFFYRSIENTGDELGYAIGVTIWVLPKTRVIKIIDKAGKEEQ